MANEGWDFGAATPPAAAPTAPKPSVGNGWDLGPAPGAAAPPPAAATAQVNPPTTQNTLAGLGGSVTRGVNATTMGGRALLWALGVESDDNFVNGTTTDAAQMMAAPETPGTAAGREAWQESEGFWQSLGTLLKYPEFSVNLIAEQVPQILGTAGAGAAGGAVAGGLGAGPVGAALGSIAGAGMSGAIGEWGDSFIGYLAEHGVDISDPLSLRIAMQQPDLINEAIWAAARKAAVTGVFEGVANRIGGSMAARFWVPEVSTVRKVGHTVSAVGVSAVGGGLGEIAGGLASTGQIDWREVAAEVGIGMGMSGIFEVGVPAIFERRGNRRAEQDLLSGTAPASIATPLEANGDVVQGATTITSGPVPAGPQPMVDAAVSLPEGVYSSVRRAIDERLPGRATVDQIMATLRGTKGLKAQELNETGFEERLRELAGSGSVSREDVIDIFNEANLDIQLHENEDPYSDYSPAAHGIGNNPRAITARWTTSTPWTSGHDSRFGYNNRRNPGTTLAHMRMVDLDDGSLLIHEVQSDVHQEGQNQGYYDATASRTTQDDVDEASQLLYDTMKAAGHSEDLIRTVQFALQQGDSIRLAQGMQANLQSAALAYAQTMQAYRMSISRAKAGLPGKDTPLQGSAWGDFMIRHALRYAAVNGYSKVAFAGGKLVDLAQGNPNSGRAKFYDETFRRSFKKEAERRGAVVVNEQSPEVDEPVYDDPDGEYERLIRMGHTPEAIAAMGINPTVIAPKRVTYPMTVAYLTPAAIDELRLGVPLYQQNPTGWAEVEGTPTDQKELAALEVAARGMMPIFDELIKRFKFSSNLKVVFHRNNAGVAGKTPGGKTVIDPKGFFRVENGELAIRIFLPQFKTAKELYATVAHELGHAISLDKFRHASADVKLAVEAAYQEFRTGIEGAKNLNEVFAKRDNAVRQRLFPKFGQMYKMGVDVQADEYWISKEEWFAEQVAKWATTDANPLSIAEKFFYSLARQIKGIIKAFKRALGLSYEANEDLAGWLNSFMTEMDPFTKKTDAITEAETFKENAGDLSRAGLDVGTWAGPRTTATIGQRLGLRRIFGGNVPKDLEALPAIVDKMHWGYKVGAAIWQLAKVNPRFRQLQTYKEAAEMMQKRALELQGSPFLMLQRVQKISPQQRNALFDVFEDYMRFRYLSEEDYKAGTRRRPNEQEFAALMKKHGMNEAGAMAFADVVAEIDKQTDQWLQLALKRAMRLTNPDKLAAKIASIQARAEQLKSQPNFPTALRYGKFAVVAKDKSGAIVYVDFTDSRKRQESLLSAVRGHFPEADVTPMTFDRDVGPLTSVYSGMLGEIPKNNLSPSQKEALQYLAYEENPSSMFRTRAQMREKTLKRSDDFFRILASHFFHSSRHIGRMEWEPQMRDAAAAIRELKATIPEAQAGSSVTARKQIVLNKKLAQISEMVEKHLDFTTSNKRDWAVVKSIAFHWLLGFNVAAAAIQLTQTPMITLPFLQSKFGTVSGTAATARAMLDRQSYYKRGTLAGSDKEELQILYKLEELGITDESMASEFAGAAEGRNLRKGFGGTAAGQTLFNLTQASGWMFKMSEKAARRVAALAATRLALAHPDVSYAQEALNGHGELYIKLRDEGWSERMAKALIVAKDVVDQTQGKYSKGDRPQFLRGFGGVLFMFKTYVQQMLVTMWHNKGMGVRSLLLMTAAAGFMGLPGAEDLLGLIKGVGHKFFGKDWDVETQLRELMVESFGLDSEQADVVLHGAAREGFGLPAILGALGLDFLPEVDRSSSVGFGRILPVQLDQLPGFTTNTGDGALTSVARDMGGAILGTGMQFWNALTASELPYNDPKRWESAVPRWMGNLSQMLRVGGEGRERGNTGVTITDFDMEDPTQVAEVIALGLGYQPTRLARQWDQIIAQADAAAFWDIRREMLLGQLNQAVMTGDDEARDAIIESIQSFNHALPEFAKSKVIRPDNIRASLRSRATSRARQEQGLPIRDADIPIYRHIQTLYPGAEVVDVERVR